MKILHNVLTVTRIDKLLDKIYAGLGMILVFHRPSLEGSRNRLIDEHTPAYLEACLTYFRKNNYEIISLDMVFDILKHNIDLGKKFVAFTFDDGFDNIYHYVYPLFQKYESPFAVYVTTGYVDQEASMWWYALEKVILTQERIDTDLGNQHIVATCGTLEKKRETFLEINDLIIHGNMSQLKDDLVNFFNKYGVDPSEVTKDITLTWEQIKEMSEDKLVTIGAHTVTHAKLSELSEREVEYEVAGSKERLESRIGKAVEHFSYPYGLEGTVGERDFTIVKNLGLKTATTTKCGHIFREHCNYLERLPRIYTNPEYDQGKWLAAVTSGLKSAYKNKFCRFVI